MQKEAQDQRRVMERHIRQTLLFKFPTADTGVGTNSYDQMKNQIIEEYVFEEKLKVRKKQEVIDNKKFDVLFKQIKEIELANTVKTRIIKEQRATMTRLDPSA